MRVNCGNTQKLFHIIIIYYTYFQKIFATNSNSILSVHIYVPMVFLFFIYFFFFLHLIKISNKISRRGRKGENQHTPNYHTALFEKVIHNFWVAWIGLRPLKGWKTGVAHPTANLLIIRKLPRPVFTTATFTRDYLKHIWEWIRRVLHKSIRHFSKNFHSAQLFLFALFHFFRLAMS